MIQVQVLSDLAWIRRSIVGSGELGDTGIVFQHNQLRKEEKDYDIQGISFNFK